MTMPLSTRRPGTTPLRKGRCAYGAKGCTVGSSRFGPGPWRIGMGAPEPGIAQLAHVELLTPHLEQSLWFFHDVLGLEETARRSGSVYLRAYEDFYHHTLKLTESSGPGMRH